jgi:hypothetical protein
MTMGTNMNLATFSHHKHIKLVHATTSVTDHVHVTTSIKPSVHHYKCKVKTHYNGFFWTSQFSFFGLIKSSCIQLKCIW